MLIENMDELAQDVGLRVKFTPSGRNYHPAVAEQGVTYSLGVGVYPKRGAEFQPAGAKRTRG